MFQNNKFILIGLTSLFLLVGIYSIYSNKIQSKSLIYIISVVVAGGIGNLIDRIAFGYVIDFIYIKIIDFAIFNFADMCITLGGIAMVIYILFFDKENKNAEV
jgi:signal peptidase II